ncbi:MAG: hypothetical protein INR71_03220 [Terriglobus roseus]|nr:hypothetical protein [Terriglobus roseus]
MPRRGPSPDQEPQVYLWKRCCLEKYMKWMYDDQPPSSKGQGQRYFGECMLHEGCNLTSAAPKKSALRRGGLVYSQFYGSHKELFDSRKIFPFENDGLEELAIDRRIMQAIRSVSSEEPSSTPLVRGAYLASKKRVNTALESAGGQSFGVREEHRVSWPLFKALLARTQERGGARAEQAPREEGRRPRCVWPIATESWLRYQRWNVNRFAAGFEITRAACTGVVTWERTKLMAMFLRGLRFCLQNGLSGREPALWCDQGRDKRQGRAGEVWYGLGFSDALQRFGHCWSKARVDWDSLTFLPHIGDRVRFGNGLLADVYRRQGVYIRSLFTAADRMQLAVELIARYNGEEEGDIRGRLLDWLAHICTQQLRQDVLHSIKRDLRREVWREVLIGTTPFCHRYIEALATMAVTTPADGGDDFQLAVSPHCEFREPGMLATRLFGFNDGGDSKRAGWVNKPFRKLFEQAHTLLRDLDRRQRRQRQQRHGEDGLRGHFWYRLQCVLFEYHWLLPYPNKQSLVRKSGKVRVWYPIRLKSFAPRWEAESWK